MLLTIHSCCVCLFLLQVLEGVAQYTLERLHWPPAAVDLMMRYPLRGRVVTLAKFLLLCNGPGTNNSMAAALTARSAPEQLQALELDLQRYCNQADDAEAVHWPGMQPAAEQIVQELMAERAAAPAAPVAAVAGGSAGGFAARFGLPPVNQHLADGAGLNAGGPGLGGPRSPGRPAAVPAHYFAPQPGFAPAHVAPAVSGAGAGVGVAMHGNGILPAAAAAGLGLGGALMAPAMPMAIGHPVQQQGPAQVFGQQPMQPGAQPAVQLGAGHQPMPAPGQPVGGQAPVAAGVLQGEGAFRYGEFEVVVDF